MKKLFYGITAGAVILALALNVQNAMAVINYGSAASAANSSSSGSNATLVINRPTGVSSGSFLIAGLTVNGGNGVTITPPSGWTLIRRTDNGGNVVLASYYKVAGGSEPSSYTWTLSRAFGNSRASGGIIRYSGVNNSDPIDASSGNTGNGSTASAASIDTVWNNDRVVVFFGIDDNATFGTISGANERFDVTNSDSSGPATAGDDYTQITAGSTGSKTSAISQSDYWAAQQIALRMRDTTAPTGGSITYVDGYRTTLSVPITYSIGSDAGVGLDLSTGRIRRASAVLNPGGTCGSFSGYSNLVYETDGSYTDTSVQNNMCYRYSYRIADLAGNEALYASGNTVRVDIYAPTITITAPTKLSGATITDTTINVTNTAITAANVTVDGSTTAGYSNFSCSQTDSSTVDCTIDITSSGNLVIKGVDDAGNSGTMAENSYVIDTVAPTVTITAPVKISNTTISNTTVKVTDDQAVTASNVTVDGSTTAGTANWSCSQTDSKTVDCTIDITSDGDLTIAATDDAANGASSTETGYIIDPNNPSVTITAPTKISTATITDTTIHVTNTSITASNVTIDGSTTAGTANWNCVQTDAQTVDCTVDITSSGDLVIVAVDDASNTSYQAETGYIVDNTDPVVAITAVTKNYNASITDTTIQVTDDSGILAANVTVDGSTTATVTNFNCTQTDGKTVDCTISIDSSGDLTIAAVDYASNSDTDTETGYLIDDQAPVVTITAPTKVSNATITDTTVQVTDNNAITAANVIIGATTTAGTANWNCTQTDAQTVDCTVDITSSGDLNVQAVDDLNTTSTQNELDYIVDLNPPTGGSITYSDGNYWAMFVPITYTVGTDTESGLDLASGKIQRAAADVIDESCGVFGAYNDLATENDGAYTDTAVVIGKCYKYRYVIDDNAGNTAIYDSINIAHFLYPGGGGSGPVAPLGQLTTGTTTRQILDFTINDGSPTTWLYILDVYFNADPTTVRGYAISLDPNFEGEPLLDYTPSTKYILPDVAGTYTIYVKYYSTSGEASGVIAHDITYDPALKPEPQEIVTPEETGNAGQGSTSTESGTSQDTASIGEQKIVKEVVELFTRNLGFGFRGADVKRLQIFLNDQGYVLAGQGNGSPGDETEFYGPRTFRAVKAFQEGFSDYILSPLNLTRGTGYFGNLTRDLANKILTGEFVP
ncbi:MAG: peptidoglycan-binding protein [Patescibacteria group bacterium]